MAKYVQKNCGKTTGAWQLGAGSKQEERLIKLGKIRVNGEIFELFSQEAQEKGEYANKGDYFKVDTSGYPYPIAKDWFESHHNLVYGTIWMQIPEKLLAWEINDPMTEEIQFLINNKGLKITENGFEAELWGTTERAKVDAVIIFYSIKRDDDGTIVDADFNFVARKQFSEDYHYVTK